MISLVSFHAALPCYIHFTSSNPISVEFPNVGHWWKLNDAMTSGPQIDRVNHHLPSIHHEWINSKRWTLTSHVSWSIRFEVPLTDSLAHHFLDYVHFCVRCARCMRKFEPTKTFKTPSKSFKTTTKTIKRLQKPSNAYKSQKLSHVVFLSPKGQVSLYKVLCHVYSPNRKILARNHWGGMFL